MGAAQPIFHSTLAEYLAREERHADKHEYLAGQIYAMAGGSPTHNRLCFKLAGLLDRQLAGTDCVGYSADQKIRVEAADLNTYADVVIVCGAPQFHAEHRTVLLNPRVIIEVLSPSTEAWDRGGKWSLYQQLDSLTDYLLVAQDQPQIEHYSLSVTPGERDAGVWRYVRHSGLGSGVSIAATGCELSLADVYEGIEFPAPAMRPPIQIVPE